MLPLTHAVEYIYIYIFFNLSLGKSRTSRSIWKIGMSLCRTPSSYMKSIAIADFNDFDR